MVHLFFLDGTGREKSYCIFRLYARWQAGTGRVVVDENFCVYGIFLDPRVSSDATLTILIQATYEATCIVHTIQGFSCTLFSLN